MSKARSPRLPSSITVGTKICCSPDGGADTGMGSLLTAERLSVCARQYLKYEIIVHRERAPSSPGLSRLPADGRAASGPERGTDGAAPPVGPVPGRGGGPHGDL